MLKNKLLKNGLVVSIITLFFGLAVAPSITALTFSMNVKTINTSDSKSKNNEVVKITFTNYLTNEIKKYTTVLTQEQNNELNSIINNIKNNLKNTETIEDTISIFNEAILSFQNLGLFPDHVPNKEIQKLVIAGISDPKYKIGSSSNKHLSTEGFSNKLCYIAGETNLTFTIPPVAISIHNMIFNIWKIVDRLSDFFPALEQGFITMIICSQALIITLLSKYYEKSIISGCELGLGLSTFEYYTGYQIFPPSTGWIYTNGVNGKKSIEGEIYGHLSVFHILYPNFIDIYIGVKGFSGIKIERETNETYYMGYASKVKVGSEVPNTSEDSQQLIESIDFFNKWRKQNA
ncbi:hypothetical protein AYK20_06225 [Thermoplasmatales archaeon SG8-52-1]|nr:MAG: hypothetical protein AYK20_06225 [Thermoplasmatales archaeon SG8-52-1]